MLKKLPKHKLLVVTGAVVVAVVVSAFSFYHFSVARKVKAQSPPGSCPTCKPPTEQIIYTPLVDLKDAVFTEINLNCRASQPIDVVPTFYTDTGLPIVGETIRLNPAEMRFVNVQSLIPEDSRRRDHWGGMTLA